MVTCEPSLTIDIRARGWFDSLIWMPTSVKADYSEPTYMYHMAGNFRGVLIFATFMVDLAVTKIFPPTKINAYGDNYGYASPRRWA